MSDSKMITRNASRGIAYVLALLVLVVLGTLAVAFAATVGLNARKSDNNQKAQAALLTAESGLHYMLMSLRDVRLPGTTTQETFIADLTDALGQQLDGTPNLAGQIVCNLGQSVLVPPIAVPEGTFTSYLTLVDETHCRLETIGAAKGTSRRVSIDFELVSKRPTVFDYGIASNGQIIIHGNAQVVGVNDPAEASVLSATTNHDDAIIIDGGITVSGDLYAAGTNSYVSISGNPQIAGSSDPEVYASHVHTGVDVPDFPGVDTSPLAALATNVVDSTTDTSSSGLVFNNIRIAAGTNPVFSGDVTVNGVIYVEAPNIVVFEGRTELNGLVATQESDEPLENCQIRFAGGVAASGVDALPDTPEFAPVKEHTGTFIVAPGFGVTFAGHFSAINGCIAADQHDSRISNRPGGLSH